MNIQLAYKFTGENKEEVLQMLNKIKNILEENNHKTFIPIINIPNPKSKKEIFLKTLDNINSFDILLVIMKSQEKSEGMLLETGYALAKHKKIYLAIREDINSHLTEIADKVIKFKDLEALYKNIRKI